MSHVALKRLLRRFEKLHPKYIDLSLERITRLLKKLDDPHLKLPPVIHIAGTNGKGSTLSFIRSILMEHNYKVHCYISPHLENIKERFFVANKIITNQKLYSTLKYIEIVNNKEPITFFEITTAAALYLFSKRKADFLILEVGLGGNYDATNVIKNSIIDIITPISFDHKEYLGKSLKKITNEKLGIIKNSSSILIGKQRKEIVKYIDKKLKNYQNKKIFYNKNIKILKKTNQKFTLSLHEKKYKFNNPSLIGEHQIENAALAIAACYEIKNPLNKITNKNINKALTKTLWAGRLEKTYIQNIPLYIDGAHNVGGAKELSAFLSKEKKNTWIIIGMQKNKDLLLFLKTIRESISGLVAIKIPGDKNSFSSQDIYNICKKLNIVCIKKRNIIYAKNYLLKNICPERIVITGSLYLIGKIRKLFY